MVGLLISVLPEAIFLNASIFVPYCLFVLLRVCVVCVFILLCVCVLCVFILLYVCVVCCVLCAVCCVCCVLCVVCVLCVCSSNCRLQSPHYELALGEGNDSSMKRESHEPLTAIDQQHQQHQLQQQPAWMLEEGQPSPPSSQRERHAGEVVYAEVIGGEVRCQSRESLRSDNFGRSVHQQQQQGRGLQRRASIQSESGINGRIQSSKGGRVQCDGGGKGGGGGGGGARFVRHKPTSMSARCLRGSPIQRLHRGNTDPSLLLQDSEPLPLPPLLPPTLRPVAATAAATGGGNGGGGITESREDGLGSSLPQLSIHQVCTPRQQQQQQQQQQQHHVTSPSGVSTLNDSSIPGFRDPEILVTGSDSLERLCINLPPDIYSSQILDTVPSPKWPESNASAAGAGVGEDEVDSGAVGAAGGKFQFVKEKSKSTQSLRGFITLPRGL